MGYGALKAVIRDVLLQLLLLNFSVVAVPHHYDDYPEDPSAIYTYDRFTEVERHCAPILPVLTELKMDDNRGERIKNELWFVNGDWSQEPDAVPLIPAGKKEQNDISNFNPSTKLASFWIMDVDSLRRSDKMVSVSGILEIGFTRYQFSDKPYKWSPGFETGSETIKLTITFEGVYVESDENGGERHLCLLGTSRMPDSDALSHVHRDQSSYVEDDLIMLLLRYPKTFNLTTRGIYGEMGRLATDSDPEYFGKISISSQLNAHRSRYQFGSAEVSKACSPYQDSDIWFRGDSVIFLGKDLCNYLRRISGLATFEISPNHKAFADGLFRSLVRHNQDLNFENFRLVIRNFICHPGFYGINTANVSAEFTVSSDHSLLNVPNLRDSSGLSGISLYAEGIWSSSERELCMVGCLRGADKSIMCNYRVSLFLPTAFSILRRSMVYGSITGINTESDSDDTISFENVVASPSEFLRWANSYVAYDYSKISLASASRSRHHLASLMSTLRRTLFEYPSYNPNDHRSLSYLPDDLTTRSTAVVYSPGSENFVACNCSKENEARKVVSVDLLFGSQHVHISPPAENMAYSEIRTVVLYGYLSITGKCFSNVSLSVEGLYDPTIGTMHLMGCKELRAFSIVNNGGLEQGRDCKIEIKVEYPPTIARWFLNQKLKISISSQREKQDSLYFRPVVFQTQSITYPWQSTEKQFIGRLERLKMIFLLYVAILIMIFQLKHMNNAQDKASNSYISLVMFGIQASYYFIPLITGSFVPDISADSIDSFSDIFYESVFIQVKMILICLGFSVFNHLVRASRRDKPGFANEIKVLIITVSIHALGLSFFINHYSTLSLGPPPSLPFKQIEIYWDFVLDLFLLPQIIANRLWRIRSKPLSKSYYIGYSLIRAFPHFYNYLQNLAYDSDYLSTREFQAKLHPSRLSDDIIIAMVIIFFAFLIYIQQRYGCGSIPKTEAIEESETSPEEKDSSD